MLCALLFAACWGPLLLPSDQRPPTAGLATAGARVYPPGYRAVFGLCLGVAGGALLASWFVTETSCRSVWATA